MQAKTTHQPPNTKQKHTTTTTPAKHATHPQPTPYREIEAFDAVLDDERLPEAFRTFRLPQMQDRIRTSRQQQRDRIP
jgi:hypothetical protein